MTLDKKHQALRLLDEVEKRILVLEDDRMHQSYEKAILRRMLGMSLDDDE